MTRVNIIFKTGRTYLHYSKLTLKAVLFQRQAIVLFSFYCSKVKLWHKKSYPIVKLNFSLKNQQLLVTL